MGRATLTISQAAILLGVARNTAFEAARSGELAGVPVIRVGRRLLIAAAPFREALGLDPEGQDHDEETDQRRNSGAP